jgi:hypothetical protein
MLSYPLGEAITLLTAKLAAAKKTLKGLVEDVEFIKEQVTIMEVNTARVYNFDVKRYARVFFFGVSNPSGELTAILLRIVQAEREEGGGCSSRRQQGRPRPRLMDDPLDEPFAN